MLGKMITTKDYKYKDLAPNESRYVKHKTCKESGGGTDHKKRLWIYHDRTKYVFYCHHCMEREFVYKDMTSSLFQQASQRWEKLDASVQLPADFTRQLTSEALLYLFKYEITPEQIEDAEIGWSAELRRIVFPIKDVKGSLVSYRARSLLPTTYKWLGPKGSSSGVAYHIHKHKDRSVVIVEDILSAIKLSTFTNVTALLGTNCSNEVGSYLLTNFDKITFWLDADAVNKAIKYRNDFELFADTKIITTPCDPKDIQLQDLGAYLSD